MKNMIHLKKALVSKEAFSRENSQMRGSKIFIERFRKFFRGAGKIFAFDMFSRDADCQLGGEGSQENVSIVSARGEGVPKWAFLASADI